MGQLKSMVALVTGGYYPIEGDYLARYKQS